jgi:hypothetical protein
MRSVVMLAASLASMSAPPQPIPLDYKTPGGTRTSFAPRPPVIRISLAAVVLLPLTFGAVYPIARLLPFRWDATAYAEVQTTRRGQYGGTAGFHITAQGRGRGSGTRLTSAYVGYSGMEPIAQMNIDLATMRYRLGSYGYQHVGSRPLTQAAVRDYISGGFDPATSEGQAVADAILSELQKLSSGVLPPDLTGQPYAGQVPAIRYAMAGTHLVDLGELGWLIWLPWYSPFCLPVWLLASIFACRAMLRRYDRRVAETIRAAGV